MTLDQIERTMLAGLDDPRASSRSARRAVADGSERALPRAIENQLRSRVRVREPRAMRRGRSWRQAIAISPIFTWRRPSSWPHTATS